MVKSKSVGARIARELDDEIRDIAARNNLELTEASREAAKALKELKGKKKNVREIVF